MKKILICSPTYNESKNIRKFCSEVLNLNYKLDLIIIDDNSPDGTSKIIKKLKFKYKNLILLKRKKKLGLGSALRDGMKYALKKGYDALITIDADLSHDPKEILMLINESKYSDFVIGSRFIKYGKSDYTGFRDIVSRVANKLCRIVLNMPFKEFTTSFRLYNYKCLKTLDKASLGSDGYSSQVEFFFYIYKAGLNCREVPINFRKRHGRNSKIPRLQIFYSALKLIELFFKRFFY